MIKFKRIVSAVLVAATAATMAVTASAARANIEFGAVTPTYYQADNVVSYTELMPPYCDNIVSFTSVSKDLREGNVLFAVDFTEPGKKKISQDLREKRADYMASLRLDKPFIFYMGAGYDGARQYPLEITNGPRNQLNVIVGSPRLFKDNFDITAATATKLASSSFYRLTIDYKINNHLVLPEYTTILGSEASNPYFFNTKFNNMFNSENSTTGSIQLDIRPENIGKRLPFYINSLIVGYVTISTSGKVTFQNVA
ncbi:MAG: hypothetical protein J6A41_04675 [Ruminiclostridium sp.]|nr:hypothetical protein [Ruminiclostridium sp.]